MKKNIIFCLWIGLVLGVYGQSDTSFDPGVEILHEDASFSIAEHSRILFVFKGDLHLVNFYKDLEKKLKKQFKKSSLKIGFEYKLDSGNPLSSDLKSLPKKKPNKSRFEHVLSISTADIKSWDNTVIEQRKQQFLIDIEVKSNLSKDELFSVQLQVKTYGTVLKQNEKIGEVIFALITR